MREATCAVDLVDQKKVSNAIEKLGFGEKKTKINCQRLMMFTVL